MTTNESESTTESSLRESSTAESTPKSEVETLREELEATKNRLRIVEQNVKWMAQHQAVETGKSVCPSCNSNGSLRVERTATGKKTVSCRNCGDRLI